MRRVFSTGSNARNACSRAAAPIGGPALGIFEQLRRGGGEHVGADVLDDDRRATGLDDAASCRRPGGDDGHSARCSLEHGPADLGPLRRRDHDGARSVEVGDIGCERHEAEAVFEPVLPHEPARFGFVVVCEPEQLERPAEGAAEERCGAHAAADDEERRVETALVCERRGREDELAKALVRVDEAEIRDDRARRRQAERRAGLGCVAGTEAVERDGVRDHVRRHVPELRDVGIDRDACLGESQERRPHEA